MTEMQEALAAVGLDQPSDKIQLARDKFPAGKPLIAVKLDRDETMSGKFITAVGRNWQTAGMAVAIINGHCVAANYVLGSWSAGIPKVRACHSAKCSKCGKTVLLPLAVWEAKDNARRNGIKDEVLSGLSGWEIIRRYSKCTCGGSWSDDSAKEKADLTEFAGNVLRAVEKSEKIGKFLPPLPFSVKPAGESAELGEDWEWLAKAMADNGQGVAPFVKDATGDVIVYNPGQWLGWADAFDDSGLFFVENGHDRKGRRRGFNPCGLDGL